MQDIVASFHDLERKVFPHLDKEKTTAQVAQQAQMQEVEVMRAFQWLENKRLVTIQESEAEFVELRKNGQEYQKNGLPETRFLKALAEKELSMNELSKKAKLSAQEIGACIGTLKSKAAIDMKKDKDVTFAITDQGKKLLDKESFEEQFLKSEFPLNVESLKDEERFALANLQKRKDIVEVVKRKTRSAKLTKEGQAIFKKGIGDEKYIDRLTADIIKSGSWKKQKFRKFDVTINVPQINPGKKQQYRIFLDEVKQKFVSLGFKEMTGPIVETDFWDMDALFMPQFHSARDIHDAYYVKEPKYGKLDPKLVEKVKRAHEDGFDTGSSGWQYEFDTKRTHRHLLRTQTTAASARMLASGQCEIPGKYFAVARCFRYDVIDSTHLSDFNQTEGIVVEEGLKFRHLVGLLKMFAEEFCQTDQVKVTPAYFPFTEPSAELHAKHPELGWIELGGSGMFRPEMLKPLGIDKPVIAWGLGIDRLAMFNLGLKDIRELFTHDLETLRNGRVR